MSLAFMSERVTLYGFRIQSVCTLFETVFIPKNKHRRSNTTTQTRLILVFDSHGKKNSSLHCEHPQDRHSQVVSIMSNGVQAKQSLIRLPVFLLG